MSNLFIYIPTYKRPVWLEKQLDRLAPQIASFPGRIRILVNQNSESDGPFKTIIQKFKNYPEIHFRCNPGNILANANITLGFVFAEESDFLWILSDDDIVTQTALSEIMPVLNIQSDIIHMGDYERHVTLELRRDNIFTVTQGAGLGLISVVVFRMDYIRQHLHNGFEYIESSFPHLAITLGALREYGSAKMVCIKAKNVFAYEGALSDGDYSQSKLGYGYLADFFVGKEATKMAWDWLLSGWEGFFMAKTMKTPLNNESRFYKASGYLSSKGLKFKIFLIVASGLYKGKIMAKKFRRIARLLFDKLKNFQSLGNNGERLDMKYKKDIHFEDLDVYEKSHFKRYQYAQSVIPAGLIVGDFACGTGYGSIILSEKSAKVIGVDISAKTIKEVKKRYKSVSNIEFVNKNLLDVDYENNFDYIVSFETVEHLEENLIPPLFKKFNQVLKRGGKIIISTPFMQETPPVDVPLNYHLTHEIDEKKIEDWLSKSGFEVESFKYQNYSSHEIQDSLAEKDMIICIAKKL